MSIKSQLTTKRVKRFNLTNKTVYNEKTVSTIRRSITLITFKRTQGPIKRTLYTRTPEEDQTVRGAPIKPVTTT